MSFSPPITEGRTRANQERAVTIPVMAVATNAIFPANLGFIWIQLVIFDMIGSTHFRKSLRTGLIVSPIVANIVEMELLNRETVPE